MTAPIRTLRMGVTHCNLADSCPHVPVAIAETVSGSARYSDPGCITHLSERFGRITAGEQGIRIRAFTPDERAEVEAR